MKFHVIDEAFNDIALLARKHGNDEVFLFDEYREPQNLRLLHIDIAVCGGNTAAFCDEFNGRKYRSRQFFVTELDNDVDGDILQKIKNDGRLVYDKTIFTEDMIEHQVFLAPFRFKDVGIGGGEHIAIWDDYGNDDVFCMVNNLNKVRVHCADRVIEGVFDSVSEELDKIYIWENGKQMQLLINECSKLEYISCKKI